MSPAFVPPLIAHVIYRLDFGGLENGLVNLLNRMPTDRYRHAIVCLAGYGEAFRQRLRRDDVPVISLDKQPGKDPGVYLRMQRALRRLRPDVVHTRNLGTVDMQWIAALSGVPHRVHGEHGWEASDPQGLSPKGLRIRRACRPVIHRYVPMSQDIARWLERSVGVPRGKIRQLYSGVDVERFTPTPATAGEGGGEGTVPSPPPSPTAVGEGVRIGTIGRLDPVKNQAALIEAFATLKTSHPHLRLVIVGDGPLRESLQQHAADLGVADAVTFTGARSDTPDLLRSFDVFVLPSINEGISNTILEAMASGLPVVADRVGGNPELVADGLTGALYEGADPATLAAALRPYVTDSGLRRAHGEAARARVVQNFGLDSMVARYLALYDELLGS
jgi:sugar transferase (PEP-CTERM/EpsH1 system associated)